MTLLEILERTGIRRRGRSKAFRYATDTGSPAPRIRETATHLGNTPAVCRASYIYPSVLTSYERGRVVEHYFAGVEELVSHRGVGLHASERALLPLLKRRAA